MNASLKHQESAGLRIDLPTRVDPVKAILSTSGCSTTL